MGKASSRKRFNHSNLRPVLASEMPPSLNSDYCLRCMERFCNGQTCALVTGGPSAQYREIGLLVCPECMQEPAFDVQDFLSFYFRVEPLPLNDPERIKPRFQSSRPLEGFLKLSLLDNGLWRVGLHRGHAEIWSRDEVKGSTWTDVDWTKLRYSADYGLYGPAEMITGAGFHSVVRVEFLDLRAPYPYRGLDPAQVPDFLKPFGSNH